jgi:hypothetical protein
MEEGRGRARMHGRLAYRGVKGEKHLQCKMHAGALVAAKLQSSDIDHQTQLGMDESSLYGSRCSARASAVIDSLHSTCDIQ